MGSASNAFPLLAGAGVVDFAAFTGAFAVFLFVGWGIFIPATFTLLGTGLGIFLSIVAFLLAVTFSEYRFGSPICAKSYKFFSYDVASLSWSCSSFYADLFPASADRWALRIAFFANELYSDFGGFGTASYAAPDLFNVLNCLLPAGWLLNHLALGADTYGDKLLNFVILFGFIAGVSAPCI